VAHREVSLIIPPPPGISADLLYKESYYMKLLELSRPATPSKYGRLNRSVRAPAARERVIRPPRA
jgi:hypothetical protein